MRSFKAGGKEMMNRMRRYLVTGFVIVAPFALTIYILVAVFDFVDGILGNILNAYLKERIGFYIPGLGFILFVFLIMFVGFLATRFIGRKILPHLERWVSRLPLFGRIYPTLKQMISFISAQKDFGFKKVVLVEYPSKGIWSLGFLTNDEFKKISCITNRDMVSVLVPSTPSPLSGYVIFVPKEEIKFVEMPIKEAMNIVISGGFFKTES